MCLSRVVFPEPKKPLSNVSGSFFSDISTISYINASIVTTACDGNSCNAHQMTDTSTVNLPPRGDDSSNIFSRSSSTNNNVGILCLSLP